jgi:hypothetical protein
VLPRILGRLGQAVQRQYPQEREAAMDATGLESSTASAHFMSRSGRERKKWVKVSVVVLLGSLVPVAAELS